MSSTFTERVYRAVRNIPKGETRTYAEIARAAGSPRAARVVGTALKHNTDPNTPCHRVIKSDGSLGEYNKGRTQKRARLIAEGAVSEK